MTGPKQATGLETTTQASSRNSRELWNTQADKWIAKNQQQKLSRRRQTMVAFIEGHVRGGKVLDIGCGDGSLCRELSQRGFDVYGCDVSEKLVEASQAMLADILPDAAERIRLIEENRIPFDQQFDVIAILGVLIYIPDHEAYMREVSRLLCPGGVLVASSTQRCSLRTLYDIFRHLFHPAFKNPEWRQGIVNLWRTGTWSGGFLPARGSGRTFSIRGLERVLRAVGLAPLDRLYVYHLEALDAHPLRRTWLGKMVARCLGWRQTVLARKNTDSSETDRKKESLHA